MNDMIEEAIKEIGKFLTQYTIENGRISHYVFCPNPEVTKEELNNDVKDLLRSKLEEAYKQGREDERGGPTGEELLRAAKNTFNPKKFLKLAGEVKKIREEEGRI